MRAGRPGAGDHLVRALRSIVASADDVTVKAEAVESQSWTSITFAGERHRLRLHIAGRSADAAVDKLAAALADLDPDLPGQLLVDIALAAKEPEPDGGINVVLNAVTVEDG